MTGHMTTIATFNDPLTAEAAKRNLEAHDIPAILSGDVGRVVPGTPVVLEVDQDDAPRAHRTLDHAGHTPHEPPAVVLDLPGDRLASRALNVASLGLIVLPVLGQLISACLLLTLWVRGLELSHDGKRMAREARQIDLIVLGGVAFVVALLFWLL
jgi:hypothetical protein